MPVYNPGGSGSSSSSSLSRLSGPDGPPYTYSTLDKLQIPMDYPSALPIGLPDDALFWPTLTSDAAILAEGGLPFADGLNAGQFQAPRPVYTGGGLRGGIKARVGNITYPIVADTTSGSQKLVNVNSSWVQAGMAVTGSGIAASTVIRAVSGTTAYLNNAATATASGVLLSGTFANINNGCPSYASDGLLPVDAFTVRATIDRPVADLGVTSTATVTTTSGSNIVAITAGTVFPGQHMTGTGIAGGSYVIDVIGTNAYLTANASASGAGVTATLAWDNAFICKALGAIQTFTFQITGQTLTATIQVDETLLFSGATGAIGSNNSITATISLAAGDIPAGVPTIVTCTWDSTIANGLKLSISDANSASASKTANSTNSANPAWLTRPFSGDPKMKSGQGLTIGMDRAGGGTPTFLPVADFWIGRYARIAGNQILTKDARGLTVDVTADNGAWSTKQRLGGMIYQYTGWADNETGETTPTDYSAIRTAQIQLAIDAGCRDWRVTEAYARAIPTVAKWYGTGTTASGSNQVTSYTNTSGAAANGDVISGPGIPKGTTILSGAGTATITMSANAGAGFGTGAVGGGRISSVTYTDWDAHLNRLFTAAGGKALRLHWHFGYVPAALNNSASKQTPPVDPNVPVGAMYDLMAIYYANVAGHTATLCSSNNATIASISGWNEPDQGGFWNSTVANFKDIWSRMAAQHASINAAAISGGTLPQLSGPDGSLSNSNSSGTDWQMQQGVIDQAQTDGRNPPFLSLHPYSPYTFATQYESKQGLANYSTGKITAPGFMAPEWSQLQAFAGNNNNTNSLTWENPKRYRGVWQAAYAHQMLYHLLKAGFTAAYFFRLGQYPAAQASSTSAGFESNGALANVTPVRAWPVFGAFELFWKHQMSDLTSPNVRWATATPSYPGLAAIQTYDTVSKRAVLTYSNFRVGWNPSASLPFQVAWNNLPATYTWKQWRIDKRDELGDGRPTLIAQGDQTNLPYAVDLTAMGVGAIQIG